MNLKKNRRIFFDLKDAQIILGHDKTEEDLYKELVQENKNSFNIR